MYQANRLTTVWIWWYLGRVEFCWQNFVQEKDHSRKSLHPCLKAYCWLHLPPPGGAPVCCIKDMEENSKYRFSGRPVVAGKQVDWRRGFQIDHQSDAFDLIGIPWIVDKAGKHLRKSLIAHLPLSRMVDQNSTDFFFLRPVLLGETLNHRES